MVQLMTKLHTIYKSPQNTDHCDMPLKWKTGFKLCCLIPRDLLLCAMRPCFWRNPWAWVTHWSRCQVRVLQSCSGQSPLKVNNSVAHLHHEWPDDLFALLGSRNIAICVSWMEGAANHTETQWGPSSEHKSFCYTSPTLCVCVLLNFYSIPLSSVGSR